MVEDLAMESLMISSEALDIVLTILKVILGL